jgi:hypothetical protein
LATSLHSKEEALELLRSVSAEQWREGILIWSPTRERAVRKERGKRVSYQTWPASLADRAINAITHLRKKFGGELGLEMACLRLETPHPSEGEME